MTGAANAIGGPIVSKDAAQRIVTAPVLIPDEPDRHRHWYSQKNIEEVASSFLPDGGVDAMHMNGESGYPTESYIAPQPLDFGARTVPEGSWIVSTKITDEEVWTGIERGEYTGLSVEGPVRAVYDDDGNELSVDEIAVPAGTDTGRPPEPALSNSIGGQLKIPRAPVGETWQVVFDSAQWVSVVDDPAVQQATFIVAKRAGSTYGESGTEGQETEIVMDEELENRLDSLETHAKKSAEAAEEAADSAEEAQTAAEEAAENDGGTEDGGNSGNDGGSDGGLSEDDVRNIVQDSIGDALEDADLGGSSEEDEGGDDGAELDQETLDELVEAGVLDEDDVADLEGGEIGVEKRLARIEKALQGGGRRGRGSQLDGLGDGDGSGSGRGISDAIAGGSDGGDGE